MSFLLVCLAVPVAVGSSAFTLLDVYEVSAPGSAAAHRVVTQGNATAMPQSGLHAAYTGLALANGSVIATMACRGYDGRSPLAITVRLWGDEACRDATQDCYLFQLNATTGAPYGDPGAYPDALDDGHVPDPLLPGRWVYMTQALAGTPCPTTPPGSGTAIVAVGAPAQARAIYAIYFHQGLAFDVPPAEPQGQAPPPAPVFPPPNVSQAAHLLMQYTSAVGLAKQFQLYGPAWEGMAANGSAPAILTGAFTRGWLPPGTPAATWKDHVACSTLGSNNNYLRLAEMWARAYATPGQPHYADPELLQRVLAALDFYTVSQGANGGWDDRNHGFCWVGGPARRNATGCLEGYGHQGLSRALVLLSPTLAAAPGALDMLIDNNDNPATPNVTRRQAYTTLMVASRAYLRSAVGRGHAPNQDVSDQWAALVANEALRLLSPDQVWPADRLLLLMNQSLGLLPQPNCTGLAFWEECTATLPNSLWISPLGMSMEPHGSLQGGYSDGYGDENLGMVLGPLVELTQAPYYLERALAMVATFAQLRFLDNVVNITSGQAHRSLWRPSGITWRHEDDMGHGDMFGDLASLAYLALHSGDSVVRRQLQLALELHAVYMVDLSSPAAVADVHWPDVATDAMRLLRDLPAVAALPPSGFRLPLEDASSEHVFVDAMAGTVVFQNSSMLLFASAMWRHLAEGSSGPLNNITRVEVRGSRYGQTMDVATEATAGWASLYHFVVYDLWVYLHAGPPASSQSQCIPVPWHESQCQRLPHSAGSWSNATVGPDQQLCLAAGDALVLRCAVGPARKPAA